MLHLKSSIHFFKYKKFRHSRFTGYLYLIVSWTQSIIERLKAMALENNHFADLSITSNHISTTISSDKDREVPDQSSTNENVGFLASNQSQAEKQPSCSSLR